ncbi:MAG: hypothetical protein RBS73_00580 [Prolixibacteraceae bacterium]|jgi:hypothetical protein|nr:hypothetical protein [Prolixibacteraceae bacterium]
MIKKLTAYSLILVANIVLLAHAVIPHHHHQSVICIEQKHCHDDTSTHEHSNAKPSHQDDGNKNSTSCVLKQSFLVPPSQGKHLKSYNNCSDNYNHDYYLLSNIEYSDLQPIFNVVSYFPLHSSYIISFVTSALGLRAPPTV